MDSGMLQLLLDFKTVLVGFCLIGILILMNLKKNPGFARMAIPVCSGVPIVGFLSHFHHKFDYRKKLIDMRHKYGKLCYVKMGSYKCLWLNDYKLIKEAWANPAFCGRPQLPGIVSRTHGFTGGIIFNDGKDFTEQRRFAVKHLKEQGLGKVSMEEIITDEVSKILKQIEATNGNAIHIRHLFNLASLNILWKIVTGETHNENDERVQKLLKILTRNMELQGGSMLAFFNPWIAKIFPRISGWTDYIDDARQIFNYWLKFANERINSLRNENNTLSFVDIYVQQILNCKEPESSFYGNKGVLSLAATLQDLFIAGSETSSITLTWIFLYVAEYQHFQVEMFNEIEFVMGKASPTLAYKKNMPFTEAFIYETMRHLTLAPLGMIHCTLEDTALGGYQIPKRTLVFANLHAAHNDCTVWQNPEVFNPHRFLSNTSKSLIKKDAFLAFSSGKRGCPGEALAKNELFIFVTSILQKYAVLPTETVNLVPIMGVSATPRRNKLKFVPRNIN